MKTENELIAEFMGGVKKEHPMSTIGYWDFPDYPAEGHARQVKHLKYDISWDWLMPVVDKIESLGYNFWIGKYASSVTKEGSGDPSFTVKCNNKIKVVYDVGLQFIRWYNSQNS